jgi:hypothetical protein
MTDVFVVRNQHGHYWGKAKVWVDGSSPKTVLRTRHQDEALNTLFELSSRDIELRGEVVQAVLSERGEPVIEPSQIPLPEESADTGEESGDAGDEAAEQAENPADDEQAQNPA